MTRVVLELPGDADGVEAPLVSIAATPPPAPWRRWGWAVALVPTALLLAYQRLAPGRDWPLPSWVAAVVAVGLLATAGLAFLRYVDDKSRARDERDRATLIARPTCVTGTVTARVPVTGSGAPGGGALGRSGRRHQPREAAFTITYPGPVGVVTRRVVVPAATAGAEDGPRVGDPVAVWFAEDADLELVRYHRGWAGDVLAALGGERPGAEDAGEPAGEGATSPGTDEGAARPE